tara:strand:+ start:1660 stop:3201 length:1542 start_codon:yes stop_codon:yes gene_type:complete
MKKKYINRSVKALKFIISMFIIKRIIYNKYLILSKSILLLWILSLIPWIDFINSNFKEIDFILNNNFFILIFLYFLIISLFFLLVKLVSKQNNFHLAITCSFFIWIFFNHSNLSSKTKDFLTNSSFVKYSAELALFLIILIIILTFNFNRKKFLKLFLIFFMSFNLFYSTIVFFINYNDYNTKINYSIKNTINNKPIIKLPNPPNIYFFVIDAMMPLDKFEKFYEIKLNDFKNLYLKNNFFYYKNTFNTYGGTAENFTSLFFLEEIYDPNYNAEEKRLKKNIYATFPAILTNQYSVKLISDLNYLGYKFKWIGNIYADCSRYNYKYCLSNKKENYIDLYLLQAFLQKTPILQIFNILTEFEIIKKNLNLNNKFDSIDKLSNFISSNQNYLENNKPTFFFIHDLQTHSPYIVDNNCNYKKFDGGLNFEGYKNSYLCVIKKISRIIKILDKFDNDPIIIFQSDHNWEMALNSDGKFGNRNEIFNLIKLTDKCKKSLPNNPNNILVTKHVLSCLKD